MCLYSTLTLTATECGLPALGQSAHVYNKYLYWLCNHSHDSTPCRNLAPREEQVGADVGSRQSLCPVCETKARAEADYKMAVAMAEGEYTTRVNRAWNIKLDRERNADSVEEIVSYPPRSRRRRHSSHSHGRRSWSSVSSSFS